MQRCEGVWGEASLRLDALKATVYEKAIYMPASTQVYLDSDPSWGVYTESGDLIAEAAYERLPSRDLVGQSRRIDLTGVEIVDGPFEVMVYCGPIVAHYGHFITTSLSRLWAVDGSCPALFHSHPPLFDHGACFIVDMVAAAGLTRENAFSFGKPTRISRLIVPETSLLEQTYTSPAFIEAAALVGAGIPETGRFGFINAYLSKTRLSGGVAKLADEEVVEQAFAAADFEIVYPETLSLADQVSLFRNARTIAGTISSAFHTIALAPKSKSRRVLFDYIMTPNANFALIDKGSVGRAEYYSMFNKVEKLKNDQFLAYYVARDIKSLASEMVNAAMPMTRQRLTEMSQGDYVSWRAPDGRLHKDLPLCVPDEALDQFLPA